MMMFLVRFAIADFMMALLIVWTTVDIFFTLTVWLKHSKLIFLAIIFL